MKTYLIIFNELVKKETYTLEAEKCDYDNNKGYFVFTSGEEIVSQIKKEYVVGIISK